MLVPPHFPTTTKHRHATMSSLSLPHLCQCEALSAIRQGGFPTGFITCFQGQTHRWPRLIRCVLAARRRRCHTLLQSATRRGVWGSEIMLQSHRPSVFFFFRSGHHRSCEKLQPPWGGLRWFLCFLSQPSEQTLRCDVSRELAEKNSRGTRRRRKNLLSAQMSISLAVLSGPVSVQNLCGFEICAWSLQQLC